MQEDLKINPCCENCGREMYCYAHKDAGVDAGRKRTAFIWFCSNCDAAESPRLGPAPAPRKLVPFAKALAAAMKQASSRGQTVFMSKLWLGSYKVDTEWDAHCVATVDPDGIVEETDALPGVGQGPGDGGTVRRPEATPGGVTLVFHTKCVCCGCQQPRDRHPLPRCPECGYDQYR